MPRKFHSRNSQGPVFDAPRTADCGASPSELTGIQVARWAELIADGRDEFPTSLSQPAHERLLREVRRRLRARLVQFVARAIAAQLHRDAGH